MKRLTVRSRALVGTSALCLASVLRLSAQTTAPQTGQNQTEETPLELSPFVVQAEEDTGYAAKDTLAGTRIRTDLKDVGSAIQVVTQKFLQDTNSRNSSDLLVLTTNTEVAAQGGNYTGGGDGAVIDTTAYTKPVANTRVRGLAEADNLRDFFLTDIPWDSYNVGRVDLQRGPNSILFGIGSPAGIINASVNQATFRDANKVEYQFGSFGTGRATADFNKVLIKDTLAIRIALLDDQTNYKQKPAYRNDERFYGAFRYDPKLIKNGNTSLRANYEKGDIDANYPRLTPPMDSITPWFTSMGKAVIPYQNNNNMTTFGNAQYNPWLGAAGNRIWDGLAGTFENNNPGLGFLLAASVVNYPTPPAGQETARNNTVNGSYKGIQAYDSYAFNARLPGYIIKPFKAKSLTDPSIFDYYNNMIEGDNKRSTNNFEAYNFTASQTFLDDRVGFEVGYDKQDSTWGYRNAISGDAAAISIDVMSTLADGSANPNVGRPMVIMGGGSAGSGLTNRIRENWRATAFGKFDFGDVMDKKSKLAQILGVHNFTLAYSDYQDDTFQKNWVNWYVGGAYAPVANTSVGQAGRDITPIIYLGSKASGRTSASDLNLGRVTVGITPPADAAVTQWDTTIPGFRSYAVPVVSPNANNGPYTNAVKSQNQIDSKIFVWQGQLFGGNLVPMFGWREDEATNRDAGAPNKTLGLVSNINDPLWVLPEEGTVVKGTTRTYSIVARVPQSLMSKLPGQMGFQVFYNKSENFQPDASRKDILGDPIPAPTGKTEEYGFTISMLDNRVSLKVNRYETSVTNATISGELGNSYLIGAGEAWGQAAAYHLKQDDNIWPGDGNFGTTSSGKILRWQPADEGNHVIPGDNSSPYTQAAIDKQYAIQVASVNDWYAHLLPQKMQQAWGMTGYATGSGSWSMNTVAVTGDTVSKGTEYELVASNVFTKGLDIAINASKTDARRLNIGKAYSDWIDKRYAEYKGPMGDMRLWGNGNWALQQGAGGTVRDKFENEVIPNYMLALALNGSNVSELRPWRFNITTNYTWQSGGILKGSNAGFSYRWQDKQVTGYKLNSTLNGYDINDPYYGPSEDAFDFWVGYERKLNSKITWRIQANVRNVFASDDLIPITVQPDGSPGAYRIPEPLTWSLTNSFSF